MKLRVIGYSVTAGIMAFLIVGVLVTELLSNRIEFSLLVGLPAGLAAGTLATAFVAYYLGREADQGYEKFAAAFGVSGAVFITALLASTFLLKIPITRSVIAGAAAAMVSGIAVYVWKSR